MSLPDEHGDLARRTRRTWQHGDAALDDSTTRRLATARARAVARAAAPARGLRGWMPVAAFAAVALIALGLTLLPQRSPEPVVIPLVSAEELVLAEEDLAFFEEDAAFYEWAVAVADAG